MRMLISAAAVVSLIGCAAVAGEVPSAPAAPGVVWNGDTVRVSGEGRVMTKPDRVSFTAGVETEAANVTDAVNSNSRTMTRVIEALQKAGAKKDEIRTSQLTVQPRYDYSENRGPRLTGYMVSNSVTVTRDSIDGVGPLLQAALSAGANQVSGLSFMVSDRSAVQADALRRAFADARAKAAVLAAAAGRSVGAARMISEGYDSSPTPPPRPMMMAMAEAKMADVPIESGTQEVTATVTVVFELK